MHVCGMCQRELLEVHVHSHARQGNKRNSRQVPPPGAVNSPVTLISPAWGPQWQCADRWPNTSKPQSIYHAPFLDSDYGKLYNRCGAYQRALALGLYTTNPSIKFLCFGRARWQPPCTIDSTTAISPATASSQLHICYLHSSGQGTIGIGQEDAQLSGQETNPSDARHVPHNGRDKL
jgi:hypothetical protein